MVIAEELAKKQKAISIAEFFEKNRQILGFDSGTRSLLTSVKEAVDNSLDACEESGILPDIFIKLENTSRTNLTLIVEDNGPGIVKEQIPRVLQNYSMDRVSCGQTKPRPAGHRHLCDRPLFPVNFRQARKNYFQNRPRCACSLF